MSSTVEALREGLASGVWTDYLPGERVLCSRFQVSRPTLRSAIQIIAREGLVAVSHGKRTAILKRRRRAPRARRKSVALVSKLPLHLMSRNRIFLIDYLQRALFEQGLHLELISHPGFGTQQPQRALQRLEEMGPFKAFILLICSHTVQQWFCKAGLPVVTLGSVLSNLPMPSVDVDYRSIGRHAAGLLSGRGHRRVAWVLPATGQHAGNIETEESFLETFATLNPEAPSCEIIRAAACGEELVGQLQAVMTRKQPPTAFFVMEGFATATLVTYLLERGVRIPEEVSIITRDNDELLRWLRPEIAHYTPPLTRIASRISRMVVNLADGGSLPQAPVRMMPDFFSGASLSTANSTP